MGKRSKRLNSLNNLNDLNELITLNNLQGPEPDAVSINTKFDESQLKGLNEQQVSMVIGINEYLETNKGKKKFFMVQGGGGTGKSFSILRAIQHISPNYIVAAAPSHFAKNVLKDFLGAEYKVITVASLLGMRLTIDKETGEDILVKNYKIRVPPIEMANIIIIDEASMIDDITYDMLIKATRGKKLIVLGDYCQLPPVGQDTDSKFFSDISSELTIPMRFTGKIYDISKAFRDEVDKLRNDDIANVNVINRATDRVSSLDEHGSGYVFLQSSKTMLKLAISKFKLDKGSSYVRVIAYRNKTIDMLNKTIRASLFGIDNKQFETGEIIINNGGFTVKNFKGNDIPLINNGEIFKVIGSKPIEGPYGLACLELTLDKKFSSPIIVLADESKDVYDAILNRLTKGAKVHKGMWQKIKDFKDSFATFSYAYAISTHKVQGSTIKHTFILEGDILDVKPTTLKEKLQSLYVSISRASFRVYIFNKNYKTDNEGITKKQLNKDG